MARAQLARQRLRQMRVVVGERLPGDDIARLHVDEPLRPAIDPLRFEHVPDRRLWSGARDLQDRGRGNPRPVAGTSERTSLISPSGPNRSGWPSTLFQTLSEVWACCARPSDHLTQQRERLGRERDRAQERRQRVGDARPVFVNVEPAVDGVRRLARRNIAVWDLVEERLGFGDFRGFAPSGCQGVF